VLAALKSRKEDLQGNLHKTKCLGQPNSINRAAHLRDTSSQTLSIQASPASYKTTLWATLRASNNTLVKSKTTSAAMARF